MKAKKFLLMFVLSLSLIACSTFTFEVITPAPVAPTFTPWVEGTEMALASPTPFSTLPPFEVTQEVMEKPAGFSPVLYGGKSYDTTFFLLLGGVGADEWITPDESVSRFSGEVTYSLHSMTQEAKYFLWGETPEFSQTCKIYTVGTEAVLDEGGFTAVVDVWTITKRQLDELTTEGEFYQQAVLDWLQGQGVKDTQVGTLIQSGSQRNVSKVYPEILKLCFLIFKVEVRCL